MWRLHIVIHIFLLTLSFYRAVLHFSNYLFQNTSRSLSFASLSFSFSVSLSLYLSLYLSFFRCHIYLSIYLYIYLYICTDILFYFQFAARFIGPPVLNSKSYRFSHGIDSHICVVYIL